MLGESFISPNLNKFKIIFMPVNTLSQQTIFDAAQPVSEEYEEKIKNLNAARIAAGTVSTMGDAAAQAHYLRQNKHTIVRDNKKIGRNELCPCGSGKKYKNCCLASGKYETTHFAN